VQHNRLRFGHGFKMVLGDTRSRAAQMTLALGDTEGGPDHRHQGADQWLFVVAGTGVAAVEGERVELKERTPALISHGDGHGIRNIGDMPLQTLNVNVPPAYTEDGEELPAGRSE
jgi:mannose-6-phosphate isomerase-like protein (cupin superfamily)